MFLKTEELNGELKLNKKTIESEYRSENCGQNRKKKYDERKFVVK